MTDNKPLPADNWPIWKLIIVPAVLFGLWALLPTLYPSYSTAALFISISLVILGIAGVVLVGRGRRRLGQTLFGNAFFLLILAMGARGWFVVVGNTTTWAFWMAIIIAAYVLAWALPALNPRLSALLWKEQYTPETKFGRAFLSFSSRILPIAGSGGALIGMYGTRSGQDNLIALLVGILATIVPIGWAQVASHQFYREDRLREEQRLGVE